MFSCTAKRNEVQVDVFLEKPKEKLYNLVVDFFDVGEKPYELDGYAGGDS